MEPGTRGNGLPKVGGGGNKFHQVQGNIFIAARADDSC
jgi:hypothetical protein